MSQGQKPSDVWEFRKQDDPDSSDEVSQSSSSAEACLKQISDFVATKSRQSTDDIIHQNLFMNRPIKKDNRVQFLNHALKVDKNYGRKMKRQCKTSKVKRNNREPEPATISSNLILMHSIFEELRVKREHLLEWMRAEERKLVDDVKKQKNVVLSG